MKIQINSLQALERLIGGDSQIEIEVRQSVAENFAKKHLKTLANNELTEAANKNALRFLGEEFFLNTYGGVTLKQPYLDNLRHNVSLQVIESIRGLVTEQLAQPKETIDGMVELYSTRICTQLTDASIMRRIDELADKKIKEKLGIK
jgi:hypothetical protein